MCNIDLEKLRFLQEMGLRAAMLSAIARQPFYKDMPTNTKEERKANNEMIDKVSNRWRELLLSYKGKYQQNKNLSINDFISDVLQLQNEMTKDEFKDYYNEPGFSLGRAQKSLSIFLKYLWLYGEIDTPPACPIDRDVLNKAKKINKNISIEKWTTLDDETEYRKILDALKSIAVKHESIAVWELKEFNEDKID